MALNTQQLDATFGAYLKQKKRVLGMSNALKMNKANVDTVLKTSNNTILNAVSGSIEAYSPPVLDISNLTNGFQSAVNSCPGFASVFPEKILNALLAGASFASIPAALANKARIFLLGVVGEQLATLMDPVATSALSGLKGYTGFLDSLGVPSILLKLRQLEACMVANGKIIEGEKIEQTVLDVANLKSDFTVDTSALATTAGVAVSSLDNAFDSYTNKFNVGI